MGLLVAIGSAAIVAAWRCFVDAVPHRKYTMSLVYLLAGDTFALGRLANAPHPLVAFLRYFSRHQHPNLCVDVSSCAGGRLAIWTTPGHQWIGVL